VLEGPWPGAPPPRLHARPQVRRDGDARRRARRCGRRRCTGASSARPRRRLRVPSPRTGRGPDERPPIGQDEGMKLEGVHHITAITGDAQKNVDFYAGVMGLRLVKKTVNQDDPTVYHLLFADEKGDAGSDLTFFEYPGAPAGRAGDGMIWGI